MHRANEIRPITKRLALLKERTDCAVILVRHMNKMGGAKSAYRGLGSIDICDELKILLQEPMSAEEVKNRASDMDISLRLFIKPQELPLTLSLLGDSQHRIRLIGGVAPDCRYSWLGRSPDQL